MNTLETNPIGIHLESNWKMSAVSNWIPTLDSNWMVSIQGNKKYNLQMDIICD
jgi:hypothetical protein